MNIDTQKIIIRFLTHFVIFTVLTYFMGNFITNTPMTWSYLLLQSGLFAVMLTTYQTYREKNSK